MHEKFKENVKCGFGFGLNQMAEGSAQSKYVKLNKEQEAPAEDITPGELNQPIQIPQVLLSLTFRFSLFLGPSRNLGVCYIQDDNVRHGFSVCFLMIS